MFFAVAVAVVFFAVVLSRVAAAVSSSSCPPPAPRPPHRWAQVCESKRHVARLLHKMANIELHRVWRTWLGFVDTSHQLAEEQQRAAVLASVQVRSKTRNARNRLPAAWLLRVGSETPRFALRVGPRSTRSRCRRRRRRAAC